MSCFRINLKRCPRSISRGVPGAMSCCRISHVLHLKGISSKPRNLEFINFLLVVQRQWSSESTRGQRFSLPPLRGPLRGLVCHLWEVWFVTYERFCLFTSERLPLLIFSVFKLFRNFSEAASAYLSEVRFWPLIQQKCGEIFSQIWWNLFADCTIMWGWGRWEFC